MKAVRQSQWIAALTAAALSGAVAAQPPCQPYWQLAHSAPTSAYWRMTTFDDGAGLALYLVTRHDGFGRVLRLQKSGLWEIVEEGLEPWEGISHPFVLDDGGGPRLYVTGASFTTAHGWDYWTARWNGDAWLYVAPGMFSCYRPNPNQTILCTAPRVSVDLNGSMSIYGVRQLPLGASALVKWSGSEWIELSQADREISPYVFDLGEGPGLYALGRFTVIGGVPSQGFARWNGSTWIDLSHPEYFIHGGSRATVVYDDGTGPAIYTLNSVALGTQVMCGVKRWTGAMWENVGCAMLPAGAPPIGYFDLHVFDDGTGPGLYLTSEFKNINNIPARNIARYDSNGWSAVGQGYQGAHLMRSLPMDRGPSLIVSQRDFPPYYMGQLVGCPSCYADCDNNANASRLTVDDFTCFVNQFAQAMSMSPVQQRNHYANCTGNSTEPILTVDDFVCFINRFATGCE